MHHYVSIKTVIFENFLCACHCWACLQALTIFIVQPFKALDMQLEPGLTFVFLYFLELLLSDCATLIDKFSTFGILGVRRMLYLFFFVGWRGWNCLIEPSSCKHVECMIIDSLPVLDVILSSVCWIKHLIWQLGQLHQASLLLKLNFPLLIFSDGHKWRLFARWVENRARCCDFLRLHDRGHIVPRLPHALLSWGYTCV